MPETPVVFISHDTRDAELAAAFSDLLRNVSANELTPFCSSDNRGTEGIPYGKDWYNELLAKLSNASDVVCLFTELSLDRPWIIYEAGLARGQADIPICALYLGVPPDSKGPLGHFQNSDDSSASLAKLVRQLCKEKKLTPTDQAIKFHVEDFRNKQHDILRSRESVHSKFECFTASTLLSRETSVKKGTESKAHVYINASCPIEAWEGSFAERVMQNIMHGVNYTYVFSLHELNADPIATMIFNLCAAVKGKNKLKKLKEGLKIHMMEENYGMEYCILDAGNKFNARCYVRRPPLTPSPAKIWWVDWCYGSSAFELAEKIRKLCPDIREENGCIIRSTTSCRFYYQTVEHASKQSKENINRFVKKLSDAFEDLNPKMADNYLRACIGTSFATIGVDKNGQ